MSKRKFWQMLLFCLYTYIIANSMLFAMGIVAYDRLSLELCWKGFKLIFCQYWLLDLLYEYGVSSRNIIIVLLCIIWDIVIFIYPVLRWRRKKTIFNAWLIAFAGALIPQYINAYLLWRPTYIFDALLIMNAGYAIAWLLEKTWHLWARIKKQAQARKHNHRPERAETGFGSPHFKI